MKKNRIIIAFIALSLLLGCGKDNEENGLVYIQSDNIAAGEKLELNTDYTFTYESNKRVKSQAWTLEVFTQNNEAIEIPSFSGNTHAFIVNLPSIEEIDHREDFSRKESGMLRSRVLLTGVFEDGKLFKESFEVELPYKPQKPDLYVESIEDRWEDMVSDVIIGFSSHHDVTTYIFSQQEKDSRFILFQNFVGNINAYSLEGLYMDFGYIFKVRAKNQYGESEEAILEIGGDPDYYKH